LHSDEKNPEHMTQLCELSSRNDNKNFSDLKVEISIPTISQSKKDLLEAKEGSFSKKGYFDLYKEFSCEKFDYYGIHEGSLCRVCKQSHEEGKSIK
ncbi:18512_t:CDS:2, partial [Gigaspora rosea]